MIYYVIHSGYGEDGGFGDYSNPTWSEEPLSVDDKVIWFVRQEDAKRAVDELNDRSREEFMQTDKAGSYSGFFPMEYEYRKIVVPDSDPVGPKTAVKLVMKEHYHFWQCLDGCDKCCPVEE